jgi:transcriptional antiterminator RfaH
MAIALQLPQIGTTRRIQQLLNNERQWCAVYTKPQKEEFAELHLRQRGIDTFFPKLFLPKTGRRKQAVVSLFSNYLFVRVKVFSEDLGSVIWCPGVKRLLTIDGAPAIVEHSLIAFLMAQASPQGIIEARCNLKIGQQVSIDGGPFHGLIGIIQEPPSAKGRVKVLLEFLKRPTQVEVPLECIQTDWVPAGQQAVVNQ